MALASGAAGGRREGAMGPETGGGSRATVRRVGRPMRPRQGREVPAPAGTSVPHAGREGRRHPSETPSGSPPRGATTRQAQAEGPGQGATGETDPGPAAARRRGLPEGGPPLRDAAVGPLTTRGGGSRETRGTASGRRSGTSGLLPLRPLLGLSGEKDVDVTRGFGAGLLEQFRVRVGECRHLAVSHHLGGDTQRYGRQQQRGGGADGRRWRPRSGGGRCRVRGRPWGAPLIRPVR